MDNKTKAALLSTSQRLNIPTDWLEKLINFESKFNPAARNLVTGARGLIQFLHSTAQKLGYRNADEIVKKYPTAEKQLKKPVYDYLKQFAPFPTAQSLYMAVFYPAARNWQPEKTFPANVREANPGIKKVGDYINLVERKTPATVLKRSNYLIVGALILAGIMILNQIKKERALSWPKRKSESRTKATPAPQKEILYFPTQGTKARTAAKRKK